MLFFLSTVAYFAVPSCEHIKVVTDGNIDNIGPGWSSNSRWNNYLYVAIGELRDWEVVGHSEGQEHCYRVPLYGFLIGNVQDKTENAGP